MPGATGKPRKWKRKCSFLCACVLFVFLLNRRLQLKAQLKSTRCTFITSPPNLTYLSVCNKLTQCAIMNICTKSLLISLYKNRKISQVRAVGYFILVLAAWGGGRWDRL